MKRYDIQLEQFRARLFARICIVLIFLTQVGQRLWTNILNPKYTPYTKKIYASTLFILGALSILVLIELILYKKLKRKALKYANLINGFIYFLFLSEWLITLYAGLLTRQLHPFPYYNITSPLIWTAQTWRILLQNFIIQRWQLKIIAPLLTYSFVLGFAIYYDPQEVVSTLLRGFLQIIYIVIIYYFDDKINFKLLLTSIRQEKWVQINEFILDSIPEKIALLDLEGGIKYSSGYLKQFVKKCGYDDDVNKIFSKVRNVQQHFDVDSFEDFASGITTEKSFFEKSCYTVGADLNEKNRIRINPTDSLQELINSFKALITKKEVGERSFLMFSGKILLEDTRERSVEIKLSYIEQHSKRYILVLLRDTTQRDIMVALDDANRYKDQLLASVSHELRTPLNGNINLVEAAIRAPDTPDNIKDLLLTPALQSSKFLLHLINDILDMSQIKVQKLRLAFQPASLRETLSNSLQLLELHAKKKGICLEAHLDSLLHSKFYTDHLRLSQIVLNLLNNSVKFTSQGFVRLSAKVLGSPLLVRISVEDSGFGMKKDDIKSLFGTFTHIEVKNRARVNPTGVGLGLSIAFNLAKLLGPKDNLGIEVSSSLGRGSTFSFVIEDKRPQKSLFAQEKAYVSGNTSMSSVKSEGAEIADEHTIGVRINSCSTNLMKRNIGMSSILRRIQCLCPQVLVVDDNPFNIMAFESVLNSLHIKADSVYSGKAAIEKMLNKMRYPCSEECTTYNVVFMDQEMPEMSGIETVREIRRLQEHNFLPETKIVGCTAHGDEEEIKKFMSSGINACVKKPISVEMIRGIMDDDDEEDEVI